MATTKAKAIVSTETAKLMAKATAMAILTAIRILMAIMIVKATVTMIGL